MIVEYLDVNNVQPKSFRLYRKKGLGRYLFVLFKSPTLLLVDGEYKRVCEGCILFDRSTLQDYSAADGTEFLHDFIEFDTETEYERMLVADIPKDTVIDLALPDRITKAIRQIRDEKKTGISDYKKEILTNLALIFIYRLKEELAPADKDNRKSPHYAAFYAFRGEMYNAPWTEYSVEDACRRLCISRSYFQHLYKEFFSVPFVQDVIAARIAHAKFLLYSSNLTVGEVADRCGYSSTELFIRQFRKLTGRTPNTFRKEC